MNKTYWVCKFLFENDKSYVFPFLFMITHGVTFFNSLSE